MWKKLSSKYVLKNPWYKVRQDKVARPDGSEGVYNVVECGESVFIVPLDEDGKVVLIKQFRYTTQREGWELPAGSIGKGEDALAAARRELKEETGYTADDWKELGPAFDSMNGICDATGHVFVARSLTASPRNEQSEEGITAMQLFAPHEVIAMIKNGEVVDGLTIASLMKFIITASENGEPAGA